MINVKDKQILSFKEGQIFAHTTKLSYKNEEICQLVSELVKI